MLVDAGKAEIGKVQNFTRVKHRFGERDSLIIAHSAQIDGHQQRRHLVVGHVAVSVTADDEAYLVASKHATVALFGYDIDCSHYNFCILARSSGSFTSFSTGLLSQSVRSIFHCRPRSLA